MLSSVTKPQATIVLPPIIRQAASTMERQGKNPDSFLNLLKTSGPHFVFMFLLEKNRLMNKVCEMPKGDDRDVLIAQAALLKNLIDTLEAIK